MVEIRIHGRGGQGVQTVGHVIAQAFFAAGQFVQTFATYGGERRGAPVTAFVRVHDAPIRRRCDIEHPDAVLLFETAFLGDGSGLAGVRPGALLVVNTSQPPDALAGLGDFRVATVDALDVARRHGLGRIVNSAMLGAFARATGWLTAAGVEQALLERAPRQAEANVAACRAAYGLVRGGGAEEVRARA